MSKRICIREAKKWESSTLYSEGDRVQNSVIVMVKRKKKGVVKRGYQRVVRHTVYMCIGVNL